MIFSPSDLTVGQPESIHSSIYPSIRPSVRVRAYVRKRFLVIASPPRPLVSFFRICLRCSPNSLVGTARKWLRSFDKYGNRQPSLIFTVIASPPKQLEKLCRNFAYEFLSMCKPENESGPSANMPEWRPSLKF